MINTPHEIPKKADVLKFAETVNIPKETAESFYENYSKAKWMKRYEENGEPKRVKYWKITLITYNIASQQ